MAKKLSYARNSQDLRDTLATYNSQGPRNQGLFESLARSTQYWVFEPTWRVFGPSKFVGFRDMDYPTYLDARRGEVSGAAFNGNSTRRAIQDIVGPYSSGGTASQLNLAALLHDWSDSVLGPGSLSGLTESKWRFVELSASPSVAPGPEWSPWLPLTAATVKRAPRGPGCYRIRALEPTTRRPRSISRCVDVDEFGTLDIGESKNLRSRIGALLSCMSSSSQSGHMAGWRYTYLGLGEHYPLDAIEVSWTRCDSKADAYSTEGTELHRYVSRHKELPPLNYKFNWSKFA